MNLTNDFKKEFDNYVMSVAKEYDCDLSKDDLQIIYDSFFHKDVGIIPPMISSKVQDFKYSKEQELIQDQDMEK